MGWNGNKHIRIVLWLSIATVSLSLCVSVLIAITCRLPVSRGYTASFVLADLPPDDKELEAWLSKQPGIVTVLITREGKHLTIDYIHSGRICEQPATPD